MYVYYLWREKEIMSENNAVLEGQNLNNSGMKKYSVATWLKFILFSAFGVFAFFINVNLPEYQIVIGGWEWGLVKAQSNVLCSHLTNFIKAALYTGNPYVPAAVDAPLPPGVWTELNGAIHTGRIRCMRGYNETPLLARENTLLPISMNGGSPAQQAASDADRLTLHWFQPAGEAECILADGTRYHVQRAGEHISVRTDAPQPFHLILHQDGAETLIK